MITTVYINEDSAISHDFENIIILANVSEDIAKVYTVI